MTAWHHAGVNFWHYLLLFFGLARFPDGHPAAAETERRISRLRRTTAVVVAALLLVGLIAALAGGC